MTDYAVDEQRNVLLRTWATGHGIRAADVTAFPAEAKGTGRLSLAAALNRLSQALWRCYTHPASAADSIDVNTEGWRRQQTRDGFTDVIDAIRDPNLPNSAGMLLVSYDPVQEAAHQVGRALHRLGDAAVRQAVIDDVEAERQAVEAAELGDLTGRAVQAVELSRADASPVQVAAADKILQQDPLGGDELFLDLDPTAASVAAAHWLKAAADITAELSGVPADEVVAVADDIEALPYQTPTTVLEDLELGEKPRDIVVTLVGDAMLVAEGIAPTTHALYDLDEEDDPTDDEDEDTASGEIRLTSLDPRRPSRDLLEDLLIGIRGCRLLYGEYADKIVASPDIEDEDEDDESPEADARYAEYAEAVDDAFRSAVRARAAQDHGRLL